MTNQPSTQLLGSDSWTGVSAWDPEDESYERAMATLRAINWDLLLSISSRLRDGLTCTFADKFSVGHFNMVRRIVFIDGVSWVARVRLPVLEDELCNNEFLNSPRYLKSEVATMRFLKVNSSIPVPEVYGYDTNPKSNVGAPYVLMEYIGGTIATELVAARGLPYCTFGTPEQDLKFRERMAELQVDFSSITFDQIGSLYQDEQTQEFLIGPEVETGKGPWQTSAEYYNDTADFHLESCAKYAGPEIHAAASFANPIIFKHVMSLCGRNNSKQNSYPLTNRDLGAHNLLVNAEFEIIGIIDLDMVTAAPVEVVAQFPQLTGLDPGPPGQIETIPIVIERIKKEEPKIRAYRDLVREAEAHADQKPESRFADLMLSDAASLCRGLRKYESYQKRVNDRWMEAYLRILHKHLKPLPDPPADSS